MGILNALGVDNGFTDWWSGNRNTIAQFGAGLAAGRNPGQGVALGLQQAQQGRVADDAYATAQKEEANRQAQLNQTIQFLQNKMPDLADALSAGAPMGEVWGEAMRRMQPQNSATDPASIREWDRFVTMTPEQQSQYLVMKRSVPFLDTGTDFVRPDAVTGQTTGAPTVTKDNFTPAYDAAAGAAQAKVDVANEDAFASLNSKLPGLKQVVEELGDLADKATYTQTGQLWDNIVRETGRMPPEGAIARTKYMSMVDNQILPLLRDTFGAQFTEREGQSLKATLGAPDKSPAEKKAVLEAFIEQKIRDALALQSRLPAGQATGGGPVDYKGKYGLE